MTLDKHLARRRLTELAFTDLFIDQLGWDHYRSALLVSTDNREWVLQAVGQKRGMVAFHYPTPAGLPFPDYRQRRLIEREVARSAHEHLIIFTDHEQTTQIWQWVKREPGRPAACREHTLHRDQPGDALLQKLEAVAFSLDEEEELTLVAVAGRARAAFDVERVTRSFYREFTQQHGNFVKQVSGIPDRADHEWYASVMLNRLMFIYFVQRKGFLDGDANYLRSRLRRMQEAHGQDRFYSFYRHFLLRLFHEGLGGRDRTAELDQLLGRIPYLDGGLFELHVIERRYPDIAIPDDAFEQLFDYFDRYQWHLDERPLRADNEINPDVLGYIFEKYVNQKQMGAYYTKEDITEYISKNTVIPYLFDAARSRCRIAFENPAGPTVWDFLSADPDRYIYPAVKHGVIGDDGQIVPAGELPDFVQTGMADPRARMFDSRYNLEQAPAGDPLRLVTETWREHVARRERCLDVRDRLRRGDVRDINDLITLNLDIRQFAQDVVEGCEGPDLLRAFWRAIEGVTVLDSTCGSGAFLFAALNILEPLYDACLIRMRAFVEDLERSGEKHRPERFSDFRAVLEQVAGHPNERYFILKSIILNNLYGVDIMEEAVEICRLRLFLKLAAQVEPDSSRPNLGIEPLPDIDFNVRAGNTLVGYATAEEVKRCMTVAANGQIKMLSDEESAEFARFTDRLLTVDAAFRAFRQQQTELGGAITPADKARLRAQLKDLEDELNRHLAAEYGVQPPSPSGRGDGGEGYTRWLKSHQPFHWFIEFYGIMSRGGFDIVIGNPPYVDNRKVAADYSARGYETSECGNLYALVVERSFALLRSNGRAGLILMLNLVFSDKYGALRRKTAQECKAVWVSSYDNIPDGLFAGSKKLASVNTSTEVSQRVCIALGQTGGQQGTVLHVTDFLRWNRIYRIYVFSTLAYGTLPMPFDAPWPALGSQLAVEAFAKYTQTPSTPAARSFSKSGGYYLQLGATPRYYISAVPEQLNRSGLIELRFRDLHACQVLEVFLNSSLFYWLWRVVGDGFHLTRRTLENVAVPLTISGDHGGVLKSLTTLLAAVRPRCRTSKLNKGKLVYNVNYNAAPEATAKLDEHLAQHYGFTDEELDFIINYDVKYRLGRAAADDAG